jgi:hypothetical protein
VRASAIGRISHEPPGARPAGRFMCRAESPLRAVLRVPAERPKVSGPSKVLLGVVVRVLRDGTVIFDNRLLILQGNPPFTL